jgi:N-acetylglucosamine-6-sulfatase
MCSLHIKYLILLIAKKLGYNTFYHGKYLNQYGMKATGGPAHVPKGWDKWNGLIGNSR